MRALMLSALVILVVPVAVPIASVHGQTVAHLTMNVTGQSLTAGFNNTVAISLSNNYYNTAYGTGTIYDTDIAISLPTPLNLIGDNHWHYDSIAFGQTVALTFRVYAPTSAIGSSYQATVTATNRQLGDISTTQESHAISFTVYGWISMIIYSVQMTPSSVTPGGNATISGNVLNTGNLAAYNANVTVQSETVAPGSSSGAFIGEIDPNIPRPFSLLLDFKPTLADGNYSLTVKVSAVDTSRPSIPITSQGVIQFQVKKPTPQPFIQRQSTGLIDIIYQILRDLYNVFIGSLTGILTPLGWQMASDSHFYETAITFILVACYPR
jgi:hypothetical protein